MANTFVDKEVYKEALQEQLEELTLWKQVAEVTYTSDKVINYPYRSQPTSSSYTRGAQYTPADFTVTNDVLTIDDAEIVSEFIDKADLAQNGYVDLVEMARTHAITINEDVEATMTGLHSQAGLSLDDGDFGGVASNPLQLTASNPDDLFRSARTLIAQQRGGMQYASRFGLHAIVDPANYEFIVAFAHANGFKFADDALVEGGVPQFNGFKVYESNLLDTTTDAGTAHCLFGVNKMYHLGILNTTFGDADVIENPDRRSGWDVVTRVDRKGKIWNNMANFVIDVELVG